MNTLFNIEEFNSISCSCLQSSMSSTDYRFTILNFHNTKITSFLGFWPISIPSQFLNINYLHLRSELDEKSATRVNPPYWKVFFPFKFSSPQNRFDIFPSTRFDWPVFFVYLHVRVSSAYEYGPMFVSALLLPLQGPQHLESNLHKVASTSRVCIDCCFYVHSPPMMAIFAELRWTVPITSLTVLQ